MGAGDRTVGLGQAGTGMGAPQVAPRSGETRIWKLKLLVFEVTGGQVRGQFGFGDEPVRPVTWSTRSTATSLRN